MAIINRLPPHLANLIAAGEVVERPASVVKELVENAVDAGAKKVTVELRDGGMTFLRVTDDGCGMGPEDAKTAFLRHATSKIRTQEDLEAIGTMGFRGEALAAIASVSRIDLLTKERGSVAGTSLRLEAGQVVEESEAGCPEGTTIIIRDLFFNTPARMKFMKQDSVEGGAVSGTVQRQALAHPEVAMRLIRDGKELLNTPGDGKLLSAMAGIYGKEAGSFVAVESRWEGNRIWGFVSRPTQARASRTHQIFFVNGRPVKSRLLQSALEEAYRNQMMVGKFPACVLHLELPRNRVDVNVHPAKTEVKFLAEPDIFDCVRYGVQAALRQTQDRPQVRLSREDTPEEQTPAFPEAPQQPIKATPAESSLPPRYAPGKAAPRKGDTGQKRPAPGEAFRTMTAEEFRSFAKTLEEAPSPSRKQALRTLEAMDTIRVAQPQPVQTPEGPMIEVPAEVLKATPDSPGQSAKVIRVYLPREEKPEEQPEKPQQSFLPEPQPEEAPQQAELPMPQSISWHILGELFNTYIVVESGDEAYLIDKHAAHERILFEKLRAQNHEISAQELMVSRVCRLGDELAAIVLENQSLLDELGYGVEGFGQGTVILRRVPMDLSPEEGEDCLEKLAQDLLSGRREDRDSLRDELLHTMACKAAIKAGWNTDPKEREVLVKEVLSRDDLKHCPHGRPICVKLTKKQLERQFGRS